MNIVLYIKVIFKIQRAFSMLEKTHHSLHQDEWLLMSTEEHSVLLLYHVHLATGCNTTSFSTLSTYRSPIYYEDTTKLFS